MHEASVKCDKQEHERLAKMKLMEIGFDDLVKKFKERKVRDRKERQRIERSLKRSAVKAEKS